MIVKRTVTHPDGRVETKEIEVPVREVTKTEQSKVDVVKDKPKAKRKSVSNTHKTSSSS